MFDYVKGAGGSLFLLLFGGASLMSLGIYEHIDALVAVISVLGTIATVIATWARFTQLVNTINISVEKLQTSVEKHNTDIAIHIDPIRDERRWQELMKHIDSDRKTMLNAIERSNNAMVSRINVIEGRCVSYGRAEHEARIRAIEREALNEPKS